jgi:hypothetical protein
VFHDIFFRPFDDRTPRVRSALEVSIPERSWLAYYAASDATYRFSAVDWEAPLPSTLAVVVRSIDGDYASYEPLTITLPLAIPSPPLASSFLIHRPLWPTSAFRPIAGETAISGMITHPTLKISGLRVVMYSGAPDPLSPYTYTDAAGGFLFRLPYLGAASSAVPTIPMSIDVRDGVTPVVVSPASAVVTLGRQNRFVFVRS